MVIFNFISFDEVIVVLIRTLAIFFFAFLALRLLGRKQLAHLTVIDLLLVIALGSAVGDVMIYDETITQMLSSMIAIGAVAIFVRIIQLFVLMFSVYHNNLAGSSEGNYPDKHLTSFLVCI